MRIDEGNIFESMRLVLPEHREMMERMKQQMHVHKAPSLSEDEMQEMQYAIDEAIHGEKTIRVTTFGPFGDQACEGVPKIKGARLYLSNSEGVMPLDVENIVSIRII